MSRETFYMGHLALQHHYSSWLSFMQLLMHQKVHSQEHTDNGMPSDNFGQLSGGNIRVSVATTSASKYTSTFLPVNYESGALHMITKTYQLLHVLRPGNKEIRELSKS